MARIVIKDLNESQELDREAMRAVTGGWSGARMRLAAHAPHFRQALASDNPFRLAALRSSIR